MGLSLAVGILADLNENDEEGAEHFRDEFNTLNRFLSTTGLVAHNEPENCEAWSADMYGYSGLHYLRRIAAHLNFNGELPPPDENDSSKDSVLSKYYKAFDQAKPGILQGLFRASSQPRKFDHLIIHSDAEGYYLPQDFAKVLILGKTFPIPASATVSANNLPLSVRP